MRNTGRKGKPLKKEFDKLTSRSKIGLTESQYQEVMTDYDATIYPTRAEYMRARVVDREIKVRTINDDLEKLEQALKVMNGKLDERGVAINKMAKRLNTHKAPIQKDELTVLTQLFEQTNELLATGQVITKMVLNRS